MEADVYQVGPASAGEDHQDLNSDAPIPGHPHPRTPASHLPHFSDSAAQVEVM